MDSEHRETITIAESIPEFKQEGCFMVIQRTLCHTVGFMAHEDRRAKLRRVAALNTDSSMPMTKLRRYS